MTKLQSEADAKYALGVCKRYEKLDTFRAVFKSHWEEVALWVLPNRIGFITQQTPGRKNNVQIYDGTAPWACGELAAAIHGLLTNPATRWFQLETKDRSLMEDREVALWLDEVENIIYDTFASPEANFSSQCHELYLDLAGFGTGIMYIEETPGVGPGLRFFTLYLGQCVIGENAMGLVDTLIREFKMTARAMAQVPDWANNLPEEVEKALQEDPFKEFTLLHEVKPRTERDSYRLDPQNRPFSSCYVVKEAKWKLAEGGYPEFPFLVPRWTKMAGEVYGRSPAMMALPDIKMVNKMVETTIRSAQKIVDPPLLVPDDGFLLPIRTTPAGLNFFRTGLADNQMIRPLETKGNPGLGLDLIQNVQQQILRTFFQDRLKLQKEKVEMTRYEAEERAQENLRMMSPMTGRLEYEYLNLAVGHTFTIKQRQGALPPPPQILVERGAALKVEYVSPMARAQKSGEPFAVQQATNLLAPMAQADPTILDNFDGDVIARETPRWFGMPNKLLKSIPDRDKIRRNRALQQQAELEKVDAAQGAKVAADLAKASGKK